MQYLNRARQTDRRKPHSGPPGRRWPRLGDQLVAGVSTITASRRRGAKGSTGWPAGPLVCGHTGAQTAQQFVAAGLGPDSGDRIDQVRTTVSMGLADLVARRLTEVFHDDPHAGN
ncbi:hypothetical protein BMW24_021940 [Mycobacterium heckeshornense]|nr:hypothetical protein ACT16_16930 [Mycobacterium heckeshornense]PIJ30563.1 hypothetical protein BMW24_021940 [Mycobacterium heckeshornense]